MKVFNLGDVNFKYREIPVIKGTVFDIFGGIAQGMVGIEGQAGSGKTQLLMRLIADISKQEPVMVVLTEQSVDRWYALFDKYIKHGLANKDNINITFSYTINDKLIDELKNTKERVIVFDSVSGGLTEQNARAIVKKMRIELSEFKKKWVIGAYQVRKEGVAGGEGVLHNVEILYTINSFQLKPQNRWLYGKLMNYGYEYGDDVRLIKCEYDKLQGVKNRNIIIVDFDKDGIVNLVDLGKKEQSQDENKD